MPKLDNRGPISDRIVHQDDCWVIVHRDVGPGFEHDTSGHHCPCGPHIIDPDDEETNEQIDARILAAERKRLS